MCAYTNTHTGTDVSFLLGMVEERKNEGETVGIQGILNSKEVLEESHYEPNMSFLKKKKKEARLPFWQQFLFSRGCYGPELLFLNHPRAKLSSFTSCGG